MFTVIIASLAVYSVLVGVLSMAYGCVKSLALQPLDPECKGPHDFPREINTYKGQASMLVVCYIIVVEMLETSG